MKKFIIIMFVFGLCIGVHGIVSLFCKNPFFDYLIGSLLLAILIYLFYRLEEKTRPLPQDCIKTPCPIVYRNSDKDSLYTLPYLDLHRTKQVWGFEIADIKIAKENSESANWEDAKKISKEGVYRRIRMRLPDIIEMLIIGHNMQKIDQTIELLKENAVKADEFSFGKYWCVDVGLLGKTVPKVMYPRAGGVFKTFVSRYKPKDLKQVFFVRLVKQ